MILKGFCKYIKNFFKKEIEMRKKLKKYRVNPNESLCLAVSVVDAPAVESEFVCLGKQEMEKFVAVDKKEKRMIYGCALRADFPIYRNNGKEEYYIEFGADSIDKISKDFFKNGFQKNWTVGHEAEVENLTVCESWIKESMTLDKSIALGLDPSLPCGSWFIGCYCENDEIWNAVKNGTYHGFSLEALVGLEEFEKQIEKEQDDIEPVSIEDLAANSGLTVEAYVNEVEAERQRILDESLEMLEEETPTEPTVETPAEEPKVEEPKVDEKTVEEPKVEEPKVDNTAHLEELINSLKEEITALKEMNNGLNKKVKELSKEPSAKPVNANAKPSAADTYSAWREQMRNMIG